MSYKIYHGYIPYLTVEQMIEVDRLMTEDLMTEDYKIGDYSGRATGINGLPAKTS